MPRAQLRRYERLVYASDRNPAATLAVITPLRYAITSSLRLLPPRTAAGWRVVRNPGYLEEGRTREVRELAEEMLWIFKSQGVHKEALAALRLFCQAAREEKARVEWTRGLVKYLYRAQHNPKLRFEG